MKIYRSLSEIKLNEPTAVALGNFDGVHKGHQALIAAAADFARKESLKCAVFTFSNLPLNVIAGKTVVKSIMNFDEKAEAISKYDVDYLFSVDFDEMMRTSPPDAFTRDIVSELLKAKLAVCGFNYSYGYKGAGTAETLKAAGKELGFDVRVVDAVHVGGEIVSSTLIRRAISEGRVNQYINYTGRPYDIEGIVIKGRQIGRRIGFPTVNLALDGDMAQPMNGVYVTKTYVYQPDGTAEVCKSITNVGNKPTIGRFDKNAETHLFGFDQDIYGQKIKVEFIDLIRPEHKFDTIEALSEQIHRDCTYAENYHRI